MAFIEELCIEKYRGLYGLKMKGLRQTNLIVGDNNCGKTSVLEAIQLLRTSGSLANLYLISRQRDVLAASNANSIFDSFMCMFPRKGNALEINVTGICNGKAMSFSVEGKRDRILIDRKEMESGKIRLMDIPEGEVEAEAFTGMLDLAYGDKKKSGHIDINQYSGMTGTSSSEKDAFGIVYLSPFDHLRGNIIGKILRNEDYKNICIKALQLFDPGIQDMMIFRSDIGNSPVEYIRHEQLGDMPVSTYGDGIKKVLVISNAIAQAAGGILLIDEIEASIHKKYYDDIFRFILKACQAFDVQLFITTHSLEAIDALLYTQDYDQQLNSDGICVCTLKQAADRTLSRVLCGREVYENREAFGFEVRL